MCPERCVVALLAVCAQQHKHGGGADPFDDDDARDAFADFAAWLQQQCDEASAGAAGDDSGEDE